MSRIFLHIAVSRRTSRQQKNQIMAIRQAGYDILDSRVVSETVSGGVQAMQRRAFANMVDHKLEGR